MRRAIFVGGLVMLATGFFFALWGYSILFNYEIGLSNILADLMSVRVRPGDLEGRIMLLLGSMIGIVGLVISLYGAVTKNMKFTHQD
ncbi:MAG: hypothetical protein ACOC6H_03805 [Thermoproteota archaeon]